MMKASVGILASAQLVFSTGALFPANGNNINQGEGNLFSNPGRIVANDDSRATSSLSSGAPQTLQYIVGRGFDFSSIPAGATITRIDIAVGWVASTGGSSGLEAREFAWDDDYTAFTPTQAYAPSTTYAGTSESELTYAITTNLPSYNELTAANFCVGLQCRLNTNGETGSIDYMTVNVSWTP